MADMNKGQKKRHARIIRRSFQIGRRVSFWNCGAGKNVIPRHEKSMGVRKTGHKSKNRGKAEGKTREKPRASACDPSPSPLHFVPVSSLPTMAPGDVLLLDDALAARQSIEPAFFAVLSCPLCGTPRLITVAEFFGGAPVLCAAEECSGLYRIVEQNHFEYLPVN